VMSRIADVGTGAWRIEAIIPHPARDSSIRA
jgi:hypothetical protein